MCSLNGFNIDDSFWCSYSVTLWDNEQLIIGIILHLQVMKIMVDYFLPSEALMNSMTLMFYLLVILMFRHWLGGPKLATWEVNYPLLLVYLMPPMMVIFFNT